MQVRNYRKAEYRVHLKLLYTPHTFPGIGHHDCNTLPQPAVEMEDLLSDDIHYIITLIKSI